MISQIGKTKLIALLKRENYTFWYRYQSYAQFSGGFWVLLRISNITGPIIRLITLYLTQQKITQTFEVFNILLGKSATQCASELETCGSVAWWDIYFCPYVCSGREKTFRPVYSEFSTKNRLGHIYKHTIQNSAYNGQFC